MPTYYYPSEGLAVIVFLTILLCTLLVVVAMAGNMGQTFLYAKKCRSKSPRTAASDDRKLLPTKSELISLAIAFVFVCVMRFPLMVPTEINCDEYYHTTFFTTFGEYGQGLADVTVNTKRFTYYLFYRFVDEFCHTSPHGVRTVFIVWATLAFLVAGLLMARLWGVTDSIPATVLLLMFFSLHPYAQDYFFFRYGNGVWFFFPLAVLPLLTVRRSPSSIVLGAIALAVAYGAYQTFANVTVTAFLFYVILEGLRQLKNRTRPSYAVLCKRCRVLEILTTIFLGCVFYVLFNLIFSLFAPPEATDYMPFVDFSDPWAKIIDNVRLWIHLYASYANVYSAPFNFLLFLMLPVVLFGILALVLRRRSPVNGLERPMFALFLGLLFVAASYFGPLGALTFIEYVAFPPPRWVMFLSVFWLGVFTGAWVLFPLPSLAGRTLLVVLSTIVFAYSLFLSQLISDIFQLAQHDQANALRMVARMETLPDFPKVRRVFIVMTPYAFEYEFSNRSLRKRYFRSAFKWVHSNVNILNTVSGYRFTWVKEDDRDYQDRYEDLPPWPAPGSIVIEDDTAVIRIGMPPTEPRQAP